MENFPKQFWSKILLPRIKMFVPSTKSNPYANENKIYIVSKWKKIFWSYGRSGAIEKSIRILFPNGLSLFNMWMRIEILIISKVCGFCHSHKKLQVIAITAILGIGYCAIYIFFVRYFLFIFFSLFSSHFLSLYIIIPEIYILFLLWMKFILKTTYSIPLIAKGRLTRHMFYIIIRIRWAVSWSEYAFWLSCFYVIFYLRYLLSFVFNATVYRVDTEVLKEKKLHERKKIARDLNFLENTVKIIFLFRDREFFVKKPLGGNRLSVDNGVNHMASYYFTKNLPRRNNEEKNWCALVAKKIKIDPSILKKKLWSRFQALQENSGSVKI